MNATSQSFVKTAIPLLYRKNFFDVALLSWVEAQRSMGESVADAVRSFQSHYNLSEDEASEESLKRNYQSIKSEYMRQMKEERPMLECSKTRL